jgi:hypothetical protein
MENITRYILIMVGTKKRFSISWGTTDLILSVYDLHFVFVIKEEQSNSKYDNELVVEEYYKHDAKFSDEMARSKRT